MFFRFDRILQSLLLKEIRQMLRDRQILAMLFITPTLQMLSYGFALSPDVKHLRMAAVDMAQTPTSRELLSAFVRNGVFDMEKAGGSAPSLFRLVDDGDLDAGVVIPPEFARYVAQDKPAAIQIALSAVDANSAGIAAGYITQIINAFNANLTKAREAISPQITFLYNAGLNSSWFFVPAVIAISLTVAGVLVSTSALLREKESGTIEQLLMTPASATQILVAKIAPLIGVLFGVVMTSLSIGLTLFHVPMRGNFLLFCFVSIEYMFVLIAFGLALASYAANQRQAMLSTFFIMMPLIQLSGALSPIESMPVFFRYLSLLNPLRFYVTCLRGILLKGNGVIELWLNMLVLLIFAVIFMSISTSRFRKQLG